MKPSVALPEPSLPRTLRGISLFTLAIIPLDALAMKTVLPSQPVFDAATTGEFMRSLIVPLLWEP